MKKNRDRTESDALRALELTEARWKAILDTARDAIISIDRRGRVTLFNRAAEEIFGYSVEEVIGRNVSMLMPSPYREEHDAYIHQYEMTGEPRAIGRIRHVEGCRKDGDVFPIELSVSEARLGNDDVVYMAILRDVSERQRIERHRSAQYEVTRVLAEASSLTEATPSILRAICTGIGWDYGELWIAERGTDVLCRDGVWYGAAADLAAFEAASRKMTFPRGVGLPGLVWDTGRPRFLADVTKDPTFERLDLAARMGIRGACGFPIRTGGGIVGTMTLFSRDVRRVDTDLLRLLDSLGSQIGDFIERKRVDAAIRYSEARFEAFMNNSPAIAFMKDEGGHYIYLNRQFQERFGHTRLELRGKTDYDIWPAEIAAELRANDQAVLAADRTVELIETRPVADGDLHQWLTFKFPIVDMAGRRFLAGMGVDITERLRAEADLRAMHKIAQERERLADIGAITAKIAHDLGNPLAALSMQTQVMVRRAQRDPQGSIGSVVDPLLQLSSEVRRLEALLRELMSFAREQRLELAPVEPAPFLRDRLELWRPLANERGVDLELDVDPTARAFHADPNQLRRVLDNLIKNAIEAIEGDGRVTLRATAPSPEMVRISVADTGPGVIASVKLFHLFETTKPTGSGLGLAVAKQIVHAHGGDISHDSVEPHGAVFHIDLPRLAPGGSLAS